MKNQIVSGALVSMVVLSMFLATGCSHNIIETINIFIAQPGVPVPTGGWAFTRSGPHPSEIQGVFQSGDKQFMGLAFAEGAGDEIYLSRITFYNVDTGIEKEAVVVTADLGTYQGGVKYLIGHENPWIIPVENGEYKLRVYVGDDVVASAIFAVR